MRKLFLLFCFILSACTQVPEKTIRNPNCANIKSILVLRVTDNYVLGWVSDEVPYSAQIKYTPTDKHFVFFLKEPGEIYYPKQRIQFDTPQCLVYNGNYNYQVGNGEKINTTILIGKLEPNQFPNPEYIRQQNEKKVADITKIREKKMEQIEEIKEREEYLKNSCWIKRRQHQKCSRSK